MVLPAHDGFFDMASPEEAFNVLYRTPGTAPPAVADFSPLFASDVGDAERVRAVREAVGSSFSHRAYSGTLLVFGTFLRHLKHRLRAHALAHRVSPLALMTQDPALDRPAETAYRLLNAHVDALVAAVPLAFPPALRPLFESGDASAFFASWPAYFPSRGHAHSFFMTATMLHSLRMESLFEGDASRASPDMFSSPAFLSVLEGAAVAVRMLRSQMADDPRLRWGHLSQVATALRAGNILLAAVRVGAAGMGYEEEVGVVARFLDVVGWTYRPLGTSRAAPWDRPGLTLPCSIEGSQGLPRRRRGRRHLRPPGPGGRRTAARSRAGAHGGRPGARGGARAGAGGGDAGGVCAGGDGGGQGVPGVHSVV
ncbi:hypothetical protein DFJ74DRAFT_681033 [Hyaloraphidium curvatum]|nr:hypothetical protein DFJ74DRAFT_681033 [Hyaloraphidium curvatum]